VAQVNLLIACPVLRLDSGTAGIMSQVPLHNAVVGAACAAVVATVLAACAPQAGPAVSAGARTTPVHAPTTPRASRTPDLATFLTVGALFRGGSNGVHGCTGSVIESASRNTVITAAHCVRGDGTGMTFAPSYRDGRSRDGVWHVTGAYVLPAWQHDQDPTTDYAVLTVAPRVINGHTTQLADVTGSEALGGAPPVGSSVTVVAYNAGRDDEPVTCVAKVFRIKGFPTFDCHGFVGGSSGSPWLTIDATGHATIHGVIGGLKQGGCHEYRSHSSTFNDTVRILVDRAESDAKPDLVVEPHDPGC
jgi:V8-like Glu-specific endopeptidase